MTNDQKSLGAGLAFLSLGGGLLLYAYLTLEMGTARQMGPGYFPRFVSLCLLVLGAAIIFASGPASRIDLRHWPLRQIGMVAAAILIFAVGLDRVGFLASAFAMAFVTAKARKETSLWQATVIALAITVFCTVVFREGLGIPFRLY